VRLPNPNEQPAPQRGGPVSRAAATWLLGGLSVLMLVGREVASALRGRSEPLDVAISIGVGAMVVAAVLAARWSGIELERRHSESESFARIVRALARAASYNDVVGAIVHELGIATEADHVAVARLGPAGRSLDVTFVSMLPGTPTSRMTIPLSPSGAAAGSPGPAGGNGTAGQDAAHAAANAFHFERARALQVDALTRQIAGAIAGHLRDTYGVRNTIAQPIRSGSNVTGSIVLSRRTAETWPEAAFRLLRRAAQEAGAAMERIGNQEVAESEARTDALTGLPNRRYFDEYSNLLASRRRSSDRVGILVVDVDHFKLLNDEHGHQVGDEVLKAIAGAIAASIRGDDVAFRYGGEEFLVVLRNPAQGIAVDVGERMRNAVRNLDLSWAGVSSGVTISVGVASAQFAGEAVAAVVERADKALYAAKRAGRDRVVEAWHAAHVPG
jgi:diguanylate cyclase (GGDEF)-like protein